MTQAKGTQEPDNVAEKTTSFAKPLFLGEIHEDLIFPFPRMDEAERRKVDTLIESFRSFAAEHYDPLQTEAAGWIGDDTIAALGERGLLGLYIPQQYGGQGLSQTGYCRLFEAFGTVDPTLSVVMGVHQSIGMKGIHLFGTEEQKERFLPDLAAGRKLAAFALTEPNAGSDAYHLESKATRQADGSYRLNGEKRFIGNGSRDVVVTFARDDTGGHVALILEKGMAGFDVGRAYQTMGLRGNDLRHLYFRDVRVPKENLLGPPGEGFKVAMEILNNGRLSLGAGSIGSTRHLLKLALDHTQSRQQFGRPLSEFELVEDKIAWIVTHLYGLESMAYLTTGLVDRGVPDYSLESAMVKVAGTEFLWYAANRVFQLAGGEAYLTDQPYEKILRDIRIFPIFEGANDVMRSFIALTGLRSLADELPDLRALDLVEPIRSLGVLADYVEERIRLELHPDRLTKTHPDLKHLAAPISKQVQRLRQVSEQLLRQQGEAIKLQQRHQKRLAHIVTDIYAQIATIARLSNVLTRRNIALLGKEPLLVELFCHRAARRVEQCFEQIEQNDDEQMQEIARSTYRYEKYDYPI